jgi:hypothetical protein
MHNISNLFYFGKTLYMFRTVFQSIFRSLRLYPQNLYDIHLMLYVQSLTLDDGFYEIWFLSIFRKSVEKIQVPYIRTNITSTVHGLYIFLSYLFQFLEWNTFQTRVVWNIKAHILCEITSFRKWCPLWEVKSYCKARQATNDMAHSHCMLDTQGYKHTLRICNTWCNHCRRGKQ